MTDQQRLNKRICNRRYWRRHKHMMPSRKEYMRFYYQEHREKKLAAANKRNARLREI
jgi:hypothetical protein